MAIGLASGSHVLAAEPGNAGRTAGNGETEIVRPPTEKSFYGWKILVTGEVGAVLAAASLALPHSPLGGDYAALGFVVGAPLYALGGPIVHWTHGYFPKGLLSFGANAVVPLAAGLTAMGVTSEDHARGFARGAAIGMLIVPVVDAFVLGWEDVPSEAMTGSARPGSDIALSPAMEVRAEGCVLWGVRGGF